MLKKEHGVYNSHVYHPSEMRDDLQIAGIFGGESSEGGVMHRECSSLWYSRSG